MQKSREPDSPEPTPRERVPKGPGSEETFHVPIQDAVLQVSGRALTIREQHRFEQVFMIAVLVTLAGSFGYLWGPFAGDVKAALTIAGCGLAATLVVLRWITRRERLARFDALGVTIWHPGVIPPPPIPWALVLGYRDPEPEVVVLELARRVRLRRTIAIPTLTEHERVAVLAHLDARGIQRLDS